MKNFKCQNQGANHMDFIAPKFDFQFFFQRSIRTDNSLDNYATGDASNHIVGKQLVRARKKDSCSILKGTIKKQN